MICVGWESLLGEGSCRELSLQNSQACQFPECPVACYDDQTLEFNSSYSKQQQTHRKHIIHILEVYPRHRFPFHIAPSHRMGFSLHSCFHVMPICCRVRYCEYLSHTAFRCHSGATRSSAGPVPYLSALHWLEQHSMFMLNQCPDA